ncbi:peroxisomal ATPase PEX6 [Cydia amplana]|uniref:peroxisomal ATPase PEX6 n=1 Tax=Cydia amplana TaxID=1869771 RepID=UPI002FE57770
MNERITVQLWIIKFCLKLIYPKYNYYTFLVFLAVKFRLSYQRRVLDKKDIDMFQLRTIPAHVRWHLLKECAEENLPVLQHKCVFISKEDFLQFSAENLFYIDDGVLWLALKLTPDIKSKYKGKQNNIDKDNVLIKYNLNFLTSELHKKLWMDDRSASLDHIRIVPVVGSTLVQKDIALTSENEMYNILSSFGLLHCRDISISFHTIPSLEHAPSIAETAEVSLVVNDYDLSNDFVKVVLSNHFELPKLVSLNDIFSIELKPEVTSKYHYKYLDLVQAVGKLYFKCSKIDGRKDLEVKYNSKVIQTFFIVKGVTHLNLGENIHALKPQDEFFKSQVTGNNNLQILQSCPTGLRHKFEQIQDAISPFVTGEIGDLSSYLSSPILPMLLVSGPTGSGRHQLVKALARYNGLSCLPIDCNSLQSSTAKQTESKINSTVQKAKAAAPCMVLLDNFEVFAVDPENNEDCRVMEYFMNTIIDLYQNYTKHPILFIAVTEKVELKPNILRIFLEKFQLSRLNAQQRYEMLVWYTSAMQLNIDGHKNVTDSIIFDEEGALSKHTKDILQRVAAKTETFLCGDIDTLVHFAMRESYLKQHNSYIHLPCEDPNLHLLQEDDFNCALESIRSLQSQHLDAPKIPKVHWEDIGGLDKLKKELLKTIEFPIKYPHLFKNSSLKRSGILLYGPPGCGKTLVAKAVSTELNVSFLSVKGPELLNMYIGQSEENVRKVFESARASSPCIVFLDELDALAPRRGAAGDSGGASDRVVSQLLAELDGVTHAEDADATSLVFIMGATNRPDLLEQSLLRPGRLDKLVYVGPYRGVEEKTRVLKALCRSYKLRAEVHLADVAAALPAGCTGADLLSVVAAARSAAVRGLVRDLHAGLVKESELSPDSVVLGVSEFWQGVEAFRPSVTDEELEYYESLQSQM